MKKIADTQKSRFQEWMKKARKKNGDEYSPNSVSQYSSYITSMPNFVFKTLGKEMPNSFQLLSIQEAGRFFQEYIINIEPSLKQKRSTYLDANKITNFSSAFRLYMRFLSEEGADNFFEREDISETEKVALILARIGQCGFRKKLIAIWGGCSVTGYNEDVSLLIASHIKPWSVSSERERLDEYNGLLLTPNLDKVFDKGLITFDKDGKIKISKYLSAPEEFGIQKNMRLVLKKENKPYMEYHRDKFEQNELS